MKERRIRINIAAAVFVTAFFCLQCVSCQAIGYVVQPGEDERLLIGTMEPAILISLLLAFLLSATVYRGVKGDPFQVRLSALFVVFFVIAVLLAMWRL